MKTVEEGLYCSSGFELGDMLRCGIVIVKQTVFQFVVGQRSLAILMELPSENLLKIRRKLFCCQHFETFYGKTFLALFFKVKKKTKNCQF